MLNLPYRSAHTSFKKKIANWHQENNSTDLTTQLRWPKSQLPNMSLVSGEKSNFQFVCFTPTFPNHVFSWYFSSESGLKKEEGVGKDKSYLRTNGRFIDWLLDGNYRSCVSWIPMLTASKRSCTPWPRSRVLDAATPTWCARRPMWILTSGKMRCIFFVTLLLLFRTSAGLLNPCASSSADDVVYRAGELTSEEVCAWLFFETNLGDKCNN